MIDTTSHHRMVSSMEPVEITVSLGSKEVKYIGGMLFIYDDGSKRLVSEDGEYILCQHDESFRRLIQGTTIREVVTSR